MPKRRKQVFLGDVPGFIVDYELDKKCVNQNVYYVCLKCNRCGRFVPCETCDHIEERSDGLFCRLGSKSITSIKPACYRYEEKEAMPSE